VRAARFDQWLKFSPLLVAQHPGSPVQEKPTT
jgi:hypothetical protein